MAQVPPHLALGSISREFLEIVSTQTRLLKIDATDLMVISCVAFLSTKDALSNPSIAPEYENGNKPLPLEYCKGVYTKEVSYFLNINYETTRVRLEKLSEKGFLIKSKRQFFMPLQRGDTDFTESARIMAVNCINRLVGLQQHFASI